MVQSALQAIPACTKVREPLQRQAALRRAEPGGPGKATCTLVVGSCGWTWTTSWVHKSVGSGIRARDWYEFSGLWTFALLLTLSAALCQILSNRSLPESRLRIPCLSSPMPPSSAAHHLWTITISPMWI